MHLLLIDIFNSSNAYGTFAPSLGATPESECRIYGNTISRCQGFCKGQGIFRVLSGNPIRLSPDVLNELRSVLL